LDINDGSRVLSINGNVDPWSVLGLQSSPKYSLPVEMVEGASHHFWTHVVQETDAPEIVQVRDYIYSVVMDWLGIDIDSSDDADKLSSSSALRGRE
jgi:serine protease 16